ncbi:MAG TPA: carboxypeptidase regulatory-like domain-containing protein [Nocardioidaceae bacterium]|nr:carboxypeptidase regulatory-like domain-containing protein [Nocardioidaceae bacterium]
MGITVASGATPLFDAGLPEPSLTLDCPTTLALGDMGNLSGTLTGDADAPLHQVDVKVSRVDDFGGDPVDLGTAKTGPDGAFGKVSDTPANRGNQTYRASVDATDTYAATSDECETDVNGTTTAISADDPTGVTIGEDVSVVGQLTTTTGDPIEGAEVEAKDTVEGQPSADLATTPTDSDGNFTVTAENVAAGNHTIAFSFVGDKVYEPSTETAEFEVDSGTGLSIDPVDAKFAGDDIALTGSLTNGAGEPLAGATITGTDTVGGTATDLAEATTDSDGAFTITVPKAAAGNHTVDLSYAGSPPNKAATGQVTFQLKYETKLTLSGPADLPASPETVNFTISLKDGAGDPVSDVQVVLNDGGTWEQGTKTDANGQATYTKPGVSNEAPLRIDVTFAGNPTYWESSTHEIWKGTPRFKLTKDKPTYTAGDSASLTLSSPNGNLPTTIALKPYKRPAVPVDPSDTGETAFSPKMFRTSTLTISTEATDRWKAGTRTFTIRVAPKITQTLNGSYGQSGDTYLVRKTRDPQLTAKVLPARPGRCVTAVVQKNINGTYTTVKRACRTLTVESTASYKLIGNPAAGAKFRMRFESAADDMNMAGQGEWTYIKFTN